MHHFPAAPAVRMQPDGVPGRAGRRHGSGRPQAYSRHPAKGYPRARAHLSGEQERCAGDYGLVQETRLLVCVYLFERTNEKNIC